MGKSPKGEAVFDEHFTEVYGDRWSEIKNALFENDKKVARRNLFFPEAELKVLNMAGLLNVSDQAPNSFEIDDELFDLASLETSMLPFYRMDPASLYPAIALDVQPGERVLDMCAAPGGKTLLLIEALTKAHPESQDWDLSGEVVANELSPKRRHRMMTVMKRYLPKEVRPLVKIRGVDGSRIGLEAKEAYDRILLDAPCSGERGLVQKKSEIAQWKPKRTKSFGIRQYSLLSSAFMALKTGGRIVYSTCSISPQENDEVIKKLIKRQGDAVSVKDSPFVVGEKTEMGTQFLPDRDGWGPIYFSIIEKH